MRHIPIFPQHLFSLSRSGYYPSGSHHCSLPVVTHPSETDVLFPFQALASVLLIKGIRLAFVFALRWRLSTGMSYSVCQRFSFHNNTSPFSENFFTFAKGEKFPCEAIHISPTIHTRSCARTLSHVALVIEGARLRRDTYQKVITSSIHVRLDEMAPCMAFVTSDVLTCFHVYSVNIRYCLMHTHLKICGLRKWLIGSEVRQMSSVFPQLGFI